MLMSLHQMSGFVLHASDGEVGTVHDFFFDADWQVRFLCSRAGLWLAGRQILIAPASLRGAEWTQMNLFVDRTRDQIKNSPSIPRNGTHAGAADQDNNQATSSPGTIYIGSMIPTAAHDIRISSQAAAIHKNGSPTGDHPAHHEQTRLVSSKELTGYRIAANDGEAGHVTDLIVDVSTWLIPFLVASDKKNLAGKQILIAVDSIKQINHDEKAISLQMNRDEVQACPNFDLFISVPIMRKDETAVFDRLECRKDP